MDAFTPFTLTQCHLNGCDGMIRVFFSWMKVAVLQDSSELYYGQCFGCVARVCL